MSRARKHNVDNRQNWFKGHGFKIKLKVLPHDMRISSVRKCSLKKNSKEFPSTLKSN